MIPVTRLHPALLFALATALLWGPAASGFGVDAGAPAAPAGDGSAIVITDVQAVPLKTGWRALVTWKTNVVSVGWVDWALQPNGVGAGLQRVFDAVPGTIHTAVFQSGALRNANVFYRVTAVAEDAALTATTPILSFAGKNGVNAWNATTNTYDFNMYMRLEANLPGVGAYATAAQDFARRVHDASDGWMRLRTIVIEDSPAYEVLGNPDNIVLAFGNIYECSMGSFANGAAGSQADVTFLAGQLFIGDTFKGAVDTTCPISMPLLGGQNGAWLTHEFGHYAWWSNDLYAIGAGCDNAASDISIMDEAFIRTELDSVGTPCPAHNQVNPSWTDMIAHYPNVPNRLGLPNPGPAGDGGGVRIIQVNRTP